MNHDQLFPYIVPGPYLENIGATPPGFIRSIGHDSHVMLVEELGGVCSNIQFEQLTDEGLSIEAAHELALKNLQTLARSTEIHKSLQALPNGQRFVAWQGHWLTASCLRLPGLADWARKTLETDKICASIPQREALLIFPKGNRVFRDEMREMIREAEKHARKQVTLGLFEFVGNEIQALVE